jgi:sulfonate transport system permease protein
MTTTATPVRRSTGVPRWLRRLSGPVLILLVWWLVTATGLISTRSLPTPGAVFDGFVDLTKNGELPEAIWASFKRVFWGTLIGVSAGAAIAVLAGLTRRGEDLLDPTMQIVKSIPKYALVPLLIIWLGIDEAPKIALIALATATPVYVNTYSAIRAVDQRLVDAARSVGLGSAGLVRNVVLPGSLPGFFSGLRISIANAWLALIVAEQLNAHSGLGRLMTEAWSFYYRTDWVMVVVVTYAILGLLSLGLVRLLERRFLQWREGFQGA